MKGRKILNSSNIYSKDKINTTYYNNLPYRVDINEIEHYMKLGIDNFVGTNDNSLETQSLRISLCDKYHYSTATCYDPTEMEYFKQSDQIIKRKGKLNVIMYMFNNGFISAKKAKELSNNVDNINDQFDSCILHNRSINESEF